MPPDGFLPMLGFVIAMTATPGPNNLMVLVSGANWGLARTIPHIAGVAVGFPLMIVAVGLGLGAVFAANPQIRDILKIVAFAYILFLAWRIAQAGRPDAKLVRPRPLNMYESMVFQWVNPKAWAAMFGATTFFTAGGSAAEVGWLAATFGLVCVPVLSVWCLFGAAISRFLADDRRRRMFNGAMAVLLVVSVLPALF